MARALNIPSAPMRGLFALAVVLLLGACQAVTTAGRQIDPTLPVPVALLIPDGSGAASDAALARSLENAARMAAADLTGVRIDLRVYPTAGTAAGATDAATRAIDEGAAILIGPLYSEAANAAGLVAARRGVNVLALSNNPAIAGGNLFVLGQTFATTADRLVGHAQGAGHRSLFVVSARTPGETAGREAIRAAAAARGLAIAGTAEFDLTAEGLTNAVSRIADQVRTSGASAVVFTSDNAGAMPYLAQLLPENGLDPAQIQYIALTRLDIPPEALRQTGLQGAWFALPDETVNATFRARYAEAYDSAPHLLAGLAYDGVAAVGALVAQRRPDALSAAALTTPAGFAGVGGAFRLRPDGTSDRALAVGQVDQGSVVILDPAPRQFGMAGF